MLPKHEKEKLRQTQTTGPKITYFYAVRKVSRDGDQWPAYQVEMIGTQHDRVVVREMVGKPDTLQMVLSVAYDLMDPLQQQETSSATNIVQA